LIGKHALSNRMDQPDPPSVRIVTIRSAKGLESPVVIIAEHDGLRRLRVTNQELYCKFMYIATSRAQHYLVVLDSAASSLPVQPALSTALL
jgi:ATP-dependent exoDNAse (exonuclease V) beta subunit